MSDMNNGGGAVMDDNQQQQQQDQMAQAPQEQQQQQGRQDEGEAFKVYVKGGGIGTSLDKAQIESAFARFGEVKNVWMAAGNRGFCFVHFARKDDAETAVREMEGQDLNGVKLQVEMARRTAPGERREPRQQGGGGFESKPGDWLCPSCHVNNFARRDRCFRCGADKPHGGGGGGYDRDDRRRGRGRSRDRDDRRGGGGGGYDDRRGGGGGGYDDRRGGYDDRRGGGGGGGGARGYEDRGGRGRSKSR